MTSEPTLKICRTLVSDFGDAARRGGEILVSSDSDGNIIGDASGDNLLSSSLPDADDESELSPISRGRTTSAISSI